MNFRDSVKLTFGERDLNFIPIHDNSSRLEKLVPIQDDTIRRYILIGVNFYSSARNAPLYLARNDHPSITRQHTTRSQN